MENSYPLPAWIHKRDGRLAEFQSDKISQSLFAAGESINRPDAFMARELTDGVLHFLMAELNGATPSTSQVVEMVTKVVRELGQPEIAEAYIDFARRRHLVPTTEKDKADKAGERKASAVPQVPPPEVAARYDPRSLMRTVAAKSFEKYSLREMFTRDIAAAHEEGLITLTGLETPFEIQGGVLTPVEIGRLVETIEESRSRVGQFIAVDGPEFVDEAGTTEFPEKWEHGFCIGLRATGLHAVVNLNTSIPPSWARKLATGPLFRESAAFYEGAGMSADRLRNQILAGKNSLTWIHWHLGERDFSPINGERTPHLARLILEGSPLTIVFDRPGHPVSLAEGLDREHPALLIAVGLHLPRLAEQPGVRTAPDVFIKKLRSLARLALTAAVQKRRFLTRHRRRQPAFMVDRARLAVIPVGLEAVTRTYTSQGIVPASPGADFAGRMVHCLYEILKEEGPTNMLSACLDSPAMAHSRPTLDWQLADWDRDKPADDLDQIAGLTPWNEAISPRDQLAAANRLQAPGQAGTAWLLLPKDNSCSPEELGNILHFAWKETDIARIRFITGHGAEKQLTAPWEER